MVWLKQKHPRQLVKLALAHSNNLSRAKALDKLLLRAGAFNQSPRAGGFATQPVTSNGNIETGS